MLLTLIVAGFAQDAPSEAETPTEELAAEEALTEEEALPPGPPELIPRAVLFGNPERIRARISPDGQRLAWIAPVDGVMNVWVAPVDEIAAGEPLTNDTDRGIRSFTWAETSQHVLYTQDKDGDENWHVYSSSLESGETLDLTPFDEVAASIQQTSPEDPTHVLLSVNDRKPRLHDLYKVDITTGERERVEKNKGYLGFVTDDSLEARLATKFKLDGGTETFIKNDKGKWVSFDTVGMEDSMTTSPVGFDKAGQLYTIDSRDRNTAALYRVDIESGDKTLLFEHDKADVSDAMIDPATYEPQAVAAAHLRTEWTVLDASIQPDLDALAQVNPGELEVVSRDAADDTWVVAFTQDAGPVVYYLWEREEQSAELLFSAKPSLEGLPLVPMHAEVITARDGLELVSYLSLPAESDLDGDGRPEEDVPMVLLVHGGPWARDSWGYNSFHQWLANRGYAVLSVNFRGSTGFGKEHLNAANLEWAGAMHDDLLDAVEWAVAEGVTSPDQVAIMGGSYGGYATLVGLTFTPETFVCGVDIVGPSNLNTLLDTIPAYWKPAIELFAKRVGDPRTKEGKAFLEERSPLNKADEIERPLLIAQGANDPRVKQAESDQLVEAMQENGIPVTYVLYPDEGHGFARPENRLSFTAVTEAFLAEHLGGRLEPVAQDFEGTSITVPVGKELVPGIEAAPTEAPAAEE